METSYSSNSIAISQLKKAVEVRFGRIPATPADFGELSIAILRITDERISADTLSRVWGYKKGYSSVRQTTVRVLEHYAKANEESDFIHSVAIYADECQKGDRVRIAWLPNRVCVLSYTGDYRWRVEESINSKLQVGNTFYCRTIAQGEELIVDHLETENGIYEGFRMGNKNGLTMVEKL
ncbi:MAG: hypothetical protein K5660_08860 [Paludibacteraceae bacterium]|nr:hypothetical protein [Paludibacteraceae bacterium]